MRRYVLHGSPDVEIVSAWDLEAGDVARRFEGADEAAAFLRRYLAGAEMRATLRSLLGAEPSSAPLSRVEDPDVIATIARQIARGILHVLVRARMETSLPAFDREEEEIALNLPLIPRPVEPIEPVEQPSDDDWEITLAPLPDEAEPGPGEAEDLLDDDWEIALIPLPGDEPSPPPSLTLAEPEDDWELVQLLLAEDQPEGGAGADDLSEDDDWDLVSISTGREAAAVM